jgi:hypothetical protein
MNTITLSWEDWRAVIVILREKALPSMLEHANVIEEQLEQYGPGEPTVRRSLTDDVFLRSSTWAGWQLGILVPPMERQGRKGRSPFDSDCGATGVCCRTAAQLTLAPLSRTGPGGSPFVASRQSSPPTRSVPPCAGSLPRRDANPSRGGTRCRRRDSCYGWHADRA